MLKAVYRIHVSVKCSSLAVCINHVLVLWGKLTEAIEHVEEGDQHHGSNIDGVAPFSEIEGPRGEVSTFGEDVGKERYRIRHRRQDDEGARQIQEGHRATKRNGSETCGNDSHEECRGHGARETLRDV